MYDFEMIRLNGISPAAIACAGILILGAYTLEQYARVRSTWRIIPIRVFPISPQRVLSNLLPQTKWNPTVLFTWLERHTLYESSDTIGVISLLQGPPSLFTSSPEVIHQVMNTKAPFVKTKPAQEFVGVMGANVLASEGDTWKRHRAIVSPAFSNEGYKKVWAETLRMYQEIWTCEGWEDQYSVSLPNMYLITKKLALSIISSCGFNIPLNWTDKETDKDGKLTLYGVLKTVASSIFIRHLTPRWAYYLPIPSLRLVDTAYNQLEAFLHKQVVQRKEDIVEEIKSGMDPLEAKRDIFSRLVSASVNEEKLGLSDREIKGNTFIMLFAGHETTAHTLAVTLILLGLYEEEQERLHANIMNVIGDHLPAFEDYDSLESVVLPVAFESLRLYPAVFMMIREASEDTTLSVPKADGPGTTELFVPKGTEVILDLVGTGDTSGYNRRYYPDADTFKPSNFEGHLDATFEFSVGPRSCLGRKFAMVEIVCFLATILRDWKVEVVRDAGETREQWRERVLRARFEIVMILPDLPLKLVRRQGI
ncbi:cytochrome P450 [Ramaria rubella]|nr:cytochrome P450 [Ramaria rubella]